MGLTGFFFPSKLTNGKTWKRRPFGNHNSLGTMLEIIPNGGETVNQVIQQKRMFLRT